MRFKSTTKKDHTMETDLSRAIAERDEQLTRFAKRHPKAAKDVVNALAKVRYCRDEPYEYDCAYCGAEADEWTLIDISEVEGRSFLPYSDDVDAYQPLCTPCAIPAERARFKRLLNCDYR